MKDVTNSWLTDALVPAISSNSSFVELEAVNGKYQLKGLDEANQKIDQWLAAASEYHYDEEDAKIIKSLNAEINKYNAYLKRQIDSAKIEMFSQVESDFKQLIAKLMKLRAELQSRLDDEAKRLRAEKESHFKEMFNEMKESLPGLDDPDFAFTDVLFVSWLNKSYSEKKAQDELHSRMKSVSLLMTNAANPTKELDPILESLRKNNWDGLASLGDLQKAEEQRQRKLLEEEAAKLLAAKEEENAQLQRDASALTNDDLEHLQETVQTVKLPDVLIRIDGNDWERAQSILNASRVKYFKV